MDREDKARQLMMDFQNTLGSEQGVRVMESLKDFVKYNLSIVPMDNNGRIDINAVMRNEGKRAVITYIMAMLGKDPYKEKQQKAKSKES